MAHFGSPGFYQTLPVLHLLFFSSYLLLFIADSAQPHGALSAVAPNSTFAANVLNQANKSIRHAKAESGTDLVLDDRCTEHIQF